MSIRRFSFAVAACAALLVPTLARAQAAPVTCTDSSTTPATVISTAIYLSGSTALEPMIKAIGPAIAGAPTPHVLVYGAPGEGSCDGVHKFIAFGGSANPTKLAAGITMKYIPANYDSTKAPPTCKLDADASADVGLSDVFAEVCTGAARPAGVTDILGLAQAMLFVTNNNSTQKAISAEQAYLAFGLGMTGNAPPWTDPTYFYIRPDSSGTKNLLAAAIKVPVAQWKGTFKKPDGTNFGSGDVRDAVINQTVNAEGTLGILGADVYDGARGMLKSLAFRGFGQQLAFWPDSTFTSFDKRNVRDGHYTAFGYAHFIASVDGTGKLTNPNAQLFADVVSGANTLASGANPGIDIISIVGAKAHLVPLCAMKVQRATEGGDLKLYSPDQPCGCAFEKAVTGNAPTSCTVCTNDSPCGSGKCRHGFCEAK